MHAARQWPGRQSTEPVPIQLAEKVTSVRTSDVWLKYASNDTKEVFERAREPKKKLRGEGSFLGLIIWPGCCCLPTKSGYKEGGEAQGGRHCGKEACNDGSSLAVSVDVFFFPSLSFYEEYFPQPIPSNHPKWHVWKKRTRQEDIRACKHHEHYLNPTRRGKERP